MLRLCLALRSLSGPSRASLMAGPGQATLRAAPLTLMRIYPKNYQNIVKKLTHFQGKICVDQGLPDGRPWVGRPSGGSADYFHVSLLKKLTKYCQKIYPFSRQN